MLSAIEEGGHTRGMTERMCELEAREDVLKELLAQEPADLPDIHPNVSGIYRKKVERLTEALNTPEDRNEAAGAIRALVEKITLRPGPNRGEIDATLHSELGTILGWSAQRGALADIVQVLASASIRSIKFSPLALLPRDGLAGAHLFKEIKDDARTGLRIYPTRNNPPSD